MARKTNQTIKAFIFDMDGVLLDTIAQHKKSLSRIFKKYKIPFGIERFDEINGRNIKDIFSYIKKKYGGNFDVNGAANEKRKDNIRIAKIAAPVSGMLILIRKLKSNGFNLILASSATKKEITIFLDRFGLNDYFDCHVSGEEVRRSKPDPEIFERCARKLGLKNNECAVIEDAPNGIKAANKANMISIGITTTHVFEELEEAKIVIKKASDLYSLIN